MSTQWHPLFAKLLGLLINEYYDIQPEVPVSDLPRRGDLLILRRHTSATPPFQGLWSRLTDWNIIEFKGPSDSAEEADLELLLHVGTGLAYRLNEERRANKEDVLPYHRVSFWYLAPTLGETFLGHARSRTLFEYQTGGLWRGSVWNHPVWLLSYRDVPVEEDTIPLHLLNQTPTVPRTLGTLVVQRQELLERFAMWLRALQPDIWEEIRHMASTAKDRPIIDWEKVSKFTNLEEAVRLVPPDRVVAVVGQQRLIETMGLGQIIGASEPEKVLQELLKRVPPEQFQEMLHRLQQKD